MDHELDEKPQIHCKHTHTVRDSETVRNKSRSVIHEMQKCFHADKR